MLASLYKQRKVTGMLFRPFVHLKSPLMQLQFRSMTFYHQFSGMLINREKQVVLSSNRLGKVNHGRVKVRIRNPMVATKTAFQPPLRHDFMNFKVMSGNEILLNLENTEYLRKTELLNAILELGKRKGHEKHDWELHPYTKKAFEALKKSLGQFDAIHLSQLCMGLNRLNYNNPEMWKLLSEHVLRILHKFDAKSLANIINVFAPQREDSLEDDVVYLDKEIEKKQKQERCNDAFLQRIITIIPVFVKDLSCEELVRVWEVCVQRNLGDKRLFKEFLFFYVEKKIKKFTVDRYVRILRCLGDKKYTEDTIFWNDYIFPRIYINPWNQKDAKLIWDALIALKLKCPELNCEIPIEYIESLLKKFELIDGFESFDQSVKDGIVHFGELPEGVKTKVGTHFKTGTSHKALELAQQQVIKDSKIEEEQARLNDADYIKKKEAREARKKRRTERASKEDVLYDSD